MARQDLSLILIRAKRETESAIEQIQKAFGLPSYLMIGILDGILSKVKDGAMNELSASADRYAEDIQKEAESKGDENAAFTNKSDS